jgi:sulfhydrogenase subunit beta (sulfur reductase)
MKYTIRKEALTTLLTNLRSDGYTVVGPKLEDGVVCLSEISRVDELPRGVLDVQAPGSYRTSKSGVGYFSTRNGPHSPKKYLHPSNAELVRLKPNGDWFEEEHEDLPRKKLAFLGIRPCDLRAVQVLDRALMAKGFEDPVYAPLRKNSLMIAVNCNSASDNCFCVSMGSGPKATVGFDIAITELPDKFLLDVAEKWLPLLHGATFEEATEEDLKEEKALMDRTAASMKKKIGSADPSRSLQQAMDSGVWGSASERCLSCGNCTMVCPTCFCYSIRDDSELVDGTVSRRRVWDSCLSKEFTYAAGANPRRDKKARYRQFVMHKFSYWPEQFGLYGCVGCGRCITWCPVGIDITETVNGVASDLAQRKAIQEAKSLS